MVTVTTGDPERPAARWRLEVNKQEVYEGMSWQYRPVKGKGRKEWAEIADGLLCGLKASVSPMRRSKAEMTLQNSPGWGKGPRYVLWPKSFGHQG